MINKDVDETKINKDFSKAFVCFSSMLEVFYQLGYYKHFKGKS